MDSILLCPHCDGPLVVEELRCGIFRHGVFRDSGQQIDPHAPRAQCDEWAAQEKIYGCGRPFRVVAVDNAYRIEACDYI